MATRTEATTSISTLVDDSLLEQSTILKPLFSFIKSTRAQTAATAIWLERGQNLPDEELILNEEGAMEPAARTVAANRYSYNAFHL
jgi:hypothetical protein